MLSVFLFLFYKTYTYLYTHFVKYRNTKSILNLIFQLHFGVIANSCDFGEIGGWHVGWFDQHSQHETSTFVMMRRKDMNFMAMRCKCNCRINNQSLSFTCTLVLIPYITINKFHCKTI